MSQDIVSDALNQIMNAKRAGKTSLTLKKSSKLLISLLEMMKKDKNINFVRDGNGVEISILKLNECKSIKPRYYVKVDDIEKYLRRFLPSRKFGRLVISTNAGLLTHGEAGEKNIGGSLIAFYY